MGLVYLIGLTGGIASGKTVVASRLAEFGVVHIDADILAREVVEPSAPAFALIVEEFGPSVVAPDGSLDRAALGAIVFADPDRLARLNEITHPAVKARAAELIDAAARADDAAIVVYDVPLLVEAAVIKQHSFDLIVVVHADQQTRLERLISIRGYERAEAMHRINSQANDAERLAIADVVIDSNGTLEQTVAQTDALLSRVRAGMPTLK